MGLARASRQISTLNFLHCASLSFSMSLSPNTNQINARLAEAGDVNVKHNEVHYNHSVN